jgi:hypothetical protein
VKALLQRLIKNCFEPNKGDALKVKDCVDPSKNVDGAELARRWFNG